MTRKFLSPRAIRQGASRALETLTVGLNWLFPGQSEAPERKGFLIFARKVQTRGWYRGCLSLRGRG